MRPPAKVLFLMLILFSLLLRLHCVCCPTTSNIDAILNCIEDVSRIVDFINRMHATYNTFCKSISISANANIDSCMAEISVCVFMCSCMKNVSGDSLNSIMYAR